MTGAHQGEDRPRTPRPRRSLAWRIGTPAVVLASGALFAVSAADSGGTDLRPGRYTDLASLAQAEADEVTELQEHARDLKEEVDQLSGEVDTLPVRRARGRIEDLKDPAGLVPRSGPGLRITLSDAPVDLFQAAKDAGADSQQLNRYVVHQQDIQAVVNALWKGGATAVTIAGQRVISTTGIKCEGNAVQLQGVPYPQPYVIEAVGEPTELLAAVDSDELVAGYRADAEDPNIQMGWDLRFEDDIDAPAYDGIIAMRYAEPLR